MGAIGIQEVGYGSSMGHALTNLQREAEREYGTDPYNGHINHCTLRRDVTAEYNKAKDKNAFINDLMYKVDKREVYGVCLKPPKPNKNKTKSKVTITPQKGAKKWETRYIGYVLMDDKEVCEGKTQGECIKKARAYAEKNQCRVHISLTKVLTKGSSSIGVVEYKPAKSEAVGKYLFFGLAPY